MCLQDNILIIHVKYNEFIFTEKFIKTVCITIMGNTLVRKIEYPMNVKGRKKRKYLLTIMKNSITFRSELNIDLSCIKDWL